MSNYEAQFPDYDDVPAMINWQGESVWKDTSYKNDTSPSFSSSNVFQGFIVKVYSDYSDHAKREYNDHQFLVTVTTHDGDFAFNLLSTNDRLEVEQLIKQLEYANPSKA